MAVSIVIGAQWGDEGKGKIVDLLSKDVVVRYGGGANAGHTLVVGDTKLVTHLLPSGVMRKNMTLVLGNGMVIDPQLLMEEIDLCESLGLLKSNTIHISLDAHVVMPYHKDLDAAREVLLENSGKSIGTTKRGIGPAYESKASRRGIRIRDLLDRDKFTSLVESYFYSEMKYLLEILDAKSISDVDECIATYLDIGDRLRKYVVDSSEMLHTLLEKDSTRDVLLEGAQGAMLDIDHGTYPYVTSSSVGAAGALSGSGIGPTMVDTVIGVTKAYCTRVGEGPFPTQMNTEEDEHWRKAGGEFGATTGRPRRCGWIDLVALKKAIRINGINSLVVTKLDVMSGMGDIKICHSYDSETGEPVYVTMPGWNADISGITKWEDLPDTAREYIKYIQEELKTGITIISVGPEREQTIHRGVGGYKGYYKGHARGFGEGFLKGTKSSYRLHQNMVAKAYDKGVKAGQSLDKKHGIK